METLHPKAWTFPKRDWGGPVDVPLNILKPMDGMFNRNGMMIVDLQPGSGNIPANGGAPSSNPEIEKLISKLGARENSP